MKKTIAKKVLTLTSTILMTLLMVLGFNGTRVQADTNDTTTQNVVLTKYGFDKDVTAIDRATDQIWTGDGAKPLQGVDFTIYNVTANRLRIIKAVLIVLRLPQPVRLMTRGN